MAAVLGGGGKVWHFERMFWAKGLLFKDVLNLFEVLKKLVEMGSKTLGR